MLLESLRMTSKQHQQCARYNDGGRSGGPGSSPQVRRMAPVEVYLRNAPRTDFPPVITFDQLIITLQGDPLYICFRACRTLNPSAA